MIREGKKSPVHFERGILRYQVVTARDKDLSLSAATVVSLVLEGWRDPSLTGGFHGGCQRTKYTLVNDSHLRGE